MRHAHTMRFGATLVDGGAQFRLWAPAAQAVELVLTDAAGTQAVGAESLGDGWYEARLQPARAGQRYQWRIDGELLVPDPASRRNPQGPHAPSELVDPTDFEWDDDGWRGRPWHEAVFYQLHPGTFTPAGTLAAAAERLPELARLGITALQLTPLADFPGDFGWGYDGVLPFAPYHGYGTPQQLKAFVQAAHRLGLMVFGDVVYNHFGPDGNYLHAYAPAFFTQRHHTAWGAAINFDGEGAGTVRAFFIENALYWLQEYRFDGLRLDAVHAMLDSSEPHILHELSGRVREVSAGRHVHLVLENDSNDATRLGQPGTPGRFEGQWSGDFHHTLHVLLTGERDGYYAEYDTPLQQLAHCLAHGFARQGGPHNAPGAPPRRAAEGDVPLGRIVNFLQNHDQIGNRAFGERLAQLADPDALRLARAILLLAPPPPLLFMGEESGAPTPFLYFADWSGELRDAVRRGRRSEFEHFERYAEVAREDRLPDPCSRATFDRCKLGAAPDADAAAVAMRAEYTRLLALRAAQLVPWLPQLAPDGHVAQVQGTLLQVRWRFEGRPDTPGSARVLQLQANLGAQAADAPPLPAGAQPVHALGEDAATRLGPWSGRWHWLPAAP